MTTGARRASVLIVEDEAIIAGNIRELLSGLGYDPYAIASTSEEAIACALERCPDLVLMDIRLKGKLDGIATAELLRLRFCVPIIYLTAHADNATVDRARATEPLGYLMKPVRPSELRSTIEIALHKHAMDKALRARERWLSTTMRSIADAVVMVDLAGNITFMNEQAELLLAAKQSEVLGHPAREVLRLRGAAWSSGDTPLDYALRERRPVHLREAILEREGGVERVISDSSAPVIDQDELLGAVMVFRDVTEQRQLQKKLEIADRLSSLGTMAAGVVHEINNPLAVVMGNAELVLDRLSRGSSFEPDGADYEEVIAAQRDLVSAASRISRIVADLRVFARPEPETTGSIDIRDAIEWALRSTAHEFRHRAQLSTKLEQVPRIDGDETRLGQVFVNLLINAAQAITPGKADVNRVSVTTRTDASGAIVVEVSDTGVGMAPALLSRIFDPYFTTKPVGVGTGLGLSICHSIVSSMGGELDAESRAGEGSTFRLRLPASTQQGVAPASSPPAATTELRGRIMMVDDEDMVLRVLGRMLSAHDVVTFTDAREALLRLERDGKFDVICCDLMMPNMTGMDFYEQLLRSNPDLAQRVLFLSGGSVTPKSESFLATVTNQRLLKPFSAETLRNAVQRLLAQRRQA